VFWDDVCTDVKQLVIVEPLLSFPTRMPCLSTISCVLPLTLTSFWFFVQALLGCHDPPQRRCWATGSSSWLSIFLYSFMVASSSWVCLISKSISTSFWRILFCCDWNPYTRRLTVTTKAATLRTSRSTGSGDIQFWCSAHWLPCLYMLSYSWVPQWEHCVPSNVVSWGIPHSILTPASYGLE
jgi:hypothetical protein